MPLCFAPRVEVVTAPSVAGIVRVSSPPPTRALGGYSGDPAAFVNTMLSGINLRAFLDWAHDVAVAAIALLLAYAIRLNFEGEWWTFDS